tara:strand:- start:1999 stop:5307 length:3309 start_codon:yes stop_codon:yes gene_type:complete
MSENITVTGNKAQFNEDVVFLKDTDIRGSILFGENGTIDVEKLDINGDLSVNNVLVRNDLDVLGESDFLGIVTARKGIDFGIQRAFTPDDLDGDLIHDETGDSLKDAVSFIPSVNMITDFGGNVTEQYYGHLNVTGKYIGFTGVTTAAFQSVGIGITVPLQKLHIDGTVIINNTPGTVSAGQSIGIGTTQPTQSVHTTDNVRIEREIYDSRNLDGDPGNFLSKDVNGITWVSIEPNFSEGIFLMDESVFVPVPGQGGQVGAGQSFTIINFVHTNSLGLGTDNTLVTARDPLNPTGVATIFSTDLWGHEEGQGATSFIYRMTKVGIKQNNPTFDLDIDGNLRVTNNVEFEDTLKVEGATTLNSSLEVVGIVSFQDATEAVSFNNAPFIVKGGVGIAKKLFVQGNVDFNTQLNVDGSATFRDDVTLIADGKSFKVQNADESTKFTIESNTGDTNIQGKLEVVGVSTFFNTTESTDKDTGSVVFRGGVGINSDLNIGNNVSVDNNLIVDGLSDLDDLVVTGVATFSNTVDLDGAVKDINDDVGFSNAVGVCKTDYRLSSVGTGVSWRPSGVQTKRTIWVSKNGCDTNSGLLEGDAKATIGGAAAIAVETDTIKVRPGIYIENNPIGLRTDVTVTGEDLRLVIIQAGNPNKDIFHVRRGCLIENLNFGGTNVGIDHTNSACVAFPPPAGSSSAVSGYTAPGPATEGPSGRWRSPYVRNCTNFMTGSIGMRIDGNDATASSVGADLKSMVCDSFTQYNENGIGVSLTNDAYAQLVSIFTINTDIAIYASTGAQCDLTNSNSSFGNFGLVAVGLGSTQFTGVATNVNPAGLTIASNTPDTDTIVCDSVFDLNDNPRRPFDGQALFFQIDLDNYPDVSGTGRITAPLERLSEIKIIPGVDVSGYSAIDPPNILIRDADGTTTPKGPQGIIAEATANVSAAGTIESVNVVAQGRNYLPSQTLLVDIEGNTGLATAVTEPIFFTVESATPPTNTGLTTITFNEFIPYEIFDNDPFSLQRISRILTSSHSFEYVGTGTDINIATPLQGAIPIKANEVVSTGGAQIPFTSTDQKGNFDIGEGIQIDQTTSTIRGRDFARAIQAEVTPLILALR